MRKTHGTMSTWKNARVVVRIGSIGIACKHAMAVWEMYQSQLKATGKEISQARYNAARHLSDSSGPGTHL